MSIFFEPRQSQFFTAELHLTNGSKEKKFKVEMKNANQKNEATKIQQHILRCSDCCELGSLHINYYQTNISFICSVSIRIV
jgi:hypothetical protein